MSLLLDHVAKSLRWPPYHPVTSDPAGPRTPDPGPRTEQPRLLLIGTATDHWSSAQVAELAADREVAEALSEVYACAVADVAEEPALAILAQQALGVFAEASGWPCWLVCTPEGRPFGASPWRPVRDRERTTGLARVLLDAAEAWHTREEDCRADAARFARLRATLLAPAEGKPLRPALTLEAVEAAAMEAADPLEGGFGPAPRLNDAELLSFLLQRCARPDAPLGLVQQVERTLVARLASGVHEHLRGGFTRGSADTAGREPFHDLRLTDQARLAVVLHRAATVLGQPMLVDSARRVVARVVADLHLGGGRFAHGLHADAPAKAGMWEDGAHRRWTEVQVADLVGSEGGKLLAERFGLGEDSSVPVLSATSPDHRRLGELAARWAMAAAERPAPRRDERVLPAEQGQWLYALATLADPATADLQTQAAEVCRTIPAPDPLAAAWLARGLLAHGDRPAAEIQAKAAFAAIDAQGRVRLDAETVSDADTPDGPGGPGLLALLAIEVGQPEVAHRLVDAHRDRLRQAPLALASLAEALGRLTD